MNNTLPTLAFGKQNLSTRATSPPPHTHTFACVRSQTHTHTDAHTQTHTDTLAFHQTGREVKAHSWDLMEVSTTVLLTLPCFVSRWAARCTRSVSGTFPGFTRVLHLHIHLHVCCIYCRAFGTRCITFTFASARCLHNEPRCWLADLPRGRSFTGQRGRTDVLRHKLLHLILLRCRPCLSISFSFCSPYFWSEVIDVAKRILSALTRRLRVVRVR